VNWEKISTEIDPVRGHSAFLFQKKIFILGGRIDQNTIESRLRVWDIGEIEFYFFFNGILIDKREMVSAPKNIQKIHSPRYFHTCNLILKGEEGKEIPILFVFGGLGKKHKDKPAKNLSDLYQLSPRISISLKLFIFIDTF